MGIEQRPEGDGATLERGLFAVMQTDVANFSRSITNNEEWVAKRLHSDLANFSEIIASYDGRVMADRGDGLKAIFSSPVRCFQAAIAMQEYAFRANLATGPTGNPMKHRIGLDVGDVLLQDGKIDGAVVTIAARLETRCTPGKICFSDEFHQMTKSQIRIYRSFLGSESLKGVSRMVRVWMASIAGDLGELEQPVRDSGRERTVVPPDQGGGYWKGVLTTLAALALIAITVFYSVRAWQAANEYVSDPKDLGPEKSVHIELPGSNSADRPSVSSPKPVLVPRDSTPANTRSAAKQNQRQAATDVNDSPASPTEELSEEEKALQEEAKRLAAEQRKPLTPADDGDPATDPAATKSAPEKSPSQTPKGGESETPTGSQG